MLEFSANPEAAIGFLQRWQQEGPWVLTAIWPGKKAPPGFGKTETKIFNLGQVEAAKAWVADRNADGWNLHFTVNPTKKPMSKKPSESDIASCIGLHVDLDPKAEANDLAAEQARILGTLKAHEPKPTVVLFSGGGYQAFWALAEPISVEGGKARNRALADGLGGDSCFNPAHLMRLPGTVNWPNATKKAKGRVPALASVVEELTDWSRVYEADQFPKGDPTPAKAKGNGKAPANFKPKVVKLEDLPACVSERCKRLIKDGYDPEDPRTKEDRSRFVVWPVVSELVKAGCDDDTIISLLLDKTMVVSAHILEQQRPLASAYRTVGAVRAEAETTELHELNQRHAVIECWGGKCRVVTFTVDGLGRKVVEVQSFEDIRNCYMNRKVVVGESADGEPVSKPMGEWWLKHTFRRQYERVTFEPGKETPGALNLWQGFDVQPKKGDWSLMRRHIEDVLASGNADHAEYILRWAAHAVQHPGRPSEVALVLMGGRGVGKGVFGRAMCRIHGQHGLHITSPERLVGRFNSHLQDCCLLFADEAYWPGNPSHLGTLKGLITEPTLAIEQKGIDVTNMPNRLSVIMASNEDWVVPAGMDERRFAVFAVSDRHQKDEAYFKALFGQLQSGGLAAMLYDLLAMDLGRWHPRLNVPQTEALLDQKMRSLSPVEQWYDDLLERGRLPWDDCKRPHRATTEALFDDFGKTMPSARGITRRAIATFLRQQGWKSCSDGKQRGWEAPVLQVARDRWSKKMGGRPWPEEQDMWCDDPPPELPF